MIEDWQKWMDEHHIKLRGDPRDNGENAVPTGGGISGTQVETKVSDHAGTPGRSHIQESE